MFGGGGVIHIVWSSNGESLFGGGIESKLLLFYLKIMSSKPCVCVHTERENKKRLSLSIKYAGTHAINNTRSIFSYCQFLQNKCFVVASFQESDLIVCVCVCMCVHRERERTTNRRPQWRI